MNQHENEMLKVTRTLEQQIDEKSLTIEKYKLVLKKKKEEADNQKKKIKDNFEKNKGNEDKKLESTLAEQHRQIQKMSEQEEDINFYHSNYEEKQQDIKNEEDRYKMLLRQLAEVGAQGAEDIERTKQRINAQYWKELNEYKTEADKKAHDNISEIEQNIALQNHRLEEEAQMQEKEYFYLKEKIKQIQEDNENCQKELHSKGMTVEEHSKKQFEKNNHRWSIVLQFACHLRCLRFQ